MSTKFVEENRPGASKNTISGLLSICKGILAGNVSEDLTQKVINTVHWQADTKSKFESTLLQLVRKYHLCQYLEEDIAKIFLQEPNNHSRSMPEISDRLWKRAMMRTIYCRQIFCSIVFRTSLTSTLKRLRKKPQKCSDPWAYRSPGRQLADC